MRPIFYDHEGRPIDALAWERLDKRVALTAIDGVVVQLEPGTRLGTVIVSTALIPDHGMWTKQPVIFESMAFEVDPDPRVGWVALDRPESRRYSVRADALRGHDELVDQVRSSRLEPVVGANREPG